MDKTDFNWLSAPTIVLLLVLVGLVVLKLFTSPGQQERFLTDSSVVPGTNGNSLIVLLHGFTLDGSSLAHVQNTLMEVEGLEGADVLVPNLPLDALSMVTSSQITAELLQAIDKAWEARGENPYKSIIMVGHSAGALYARKIYAAACGENKKAPFEQALKDSLETLGAHSLDVERKWAEKVDRIVLLAGMNRGWSISHHMSIPRAALMKVGVAGGHLLNWLHDQRPTIFSIRRGSPFITQLRLQWLEMREQVRSGKKNVGAAHTVQLLGTIDDLVSPDDNIDLVSGRDFTYLEVPDSGHKTVIDMDRSESGIERRKALLHAFVVQPDVKTLMEHRDVDDVVFVIHGIRDKGFWTRKIARRVQQFGRDHDKDRVIEVETSSYGYFPMLSFLTPGARQEKVEWLMDRITEARAKYPEANFHYVGHSNGTYLLTKALEDYPAVKFDRVVFAGSVVKRDFDWNKFIPDRVNSVLNFVASADWVVAFFPKALQSVSVQDLGSAGHDGFDAAGTLTQVIEPEKYIIGGHGTALQEKMWDTIAKFIVTGEFKISADAARSEKQEWWVKYPAYIAPFLWLVIAVVLAFILYRLFKLNISEWKKTLVILGYSWAIWSVLTKV